MLERLVDVRQGERAGLWLSFTYFFTVMSGTFLLKPVRDELALVGATERLGLALLFTLTFGAMLLAVPLYSALVARLPRRRFIPLVYHFFVACLVGFWALLGSGWAPEVLARCFYVWFSVFNLFVVSVFWSFMADVFAGEQGKRLFGFIAAGGTLGTLAGPALTRLLVGPLGTRPLLLLAAALLEAGVVCVVLLARWAGAPARALPPTPAGAPGPEAPVGGSAFAGLWLLWRSPLLLGLGAQTLLYAVTSTFLYFHQQALVAATLHTREARTEFFATLELGVQALTLLMQTVVAGRLLPRAGLGVSLGLAPVVTGVGFVALAALPSLGVFAAVRSLRGATHHAFERPAREVLFTAVGREERYKAKSFIDTALLRFSDLVGAWLNTGLGALGLGLAGVALGALPLAAAWLAVALFLARLQASEPARRIDRATHRPLPPAREEAPR